MFDQQLLSHTLACRWDVKQPTNKHTLLAFIDLSMKREDGAMFKKKSSKLYTCSFVAVIYCLQRLEVRFGYHLMGPHPTLRVSSTVVCHFHLAAESIGTSTTELLVGWLVA